MNDNKYIARKIAIADRLVQERMTDFMKTEERIPLDENTLSELNNNTVKEWELKLTIGESQALEIHEGARFMKCEMKANDKIGLWAMADPSAPTRTRKFIVMDVVFSHDFYRHIYTVRSYLGVHDIFEEIY